MNIKAEYPPNYKDILAVFSTVESFRPVFCYGDTIYNPFGREQIPSDIIFHESIHARQQGSNPEMWWQMYLANEAFRLDQEIEAYGEQYLFVKKHIHSNVLNKRALYSMAQALSGESYGNLLSFSEAESKIKNYGKEN